MKRLQAAPVPEKTLAAMSSQLMVQLRPLAVSAAEQAVERLSAEMAAASAAASAAAAAAARFPPDLAGEQPTLPRSGAETLV